MELKFVKVYCQQMILVIGSFLVLSQNVSAFIFALQFPHSSFLYPFHSFKQSLPNSTNLAAHAKNSHPPVLHDLNSQFNTYGYINGWVNGRKCFDELGCLELTEEWFHPTFRPINELPASRSRINVRYMLFTRDRVTDPVQVYPDKEKLLDAGFQADKPVKFVVHGLFDSSYSNWILKLSQQLTVVMDVNVIAVDWSGGAVSTYTLATANARVVGLEISHFIKFIMNEFLMSANNFHIIGHSIGAHVGGYVGEKIPGLGRITGLDPARPYFHGLPNLVRLDPSDALFVDVIHSDGRPLIGLGLREPCGHVDFYPNDGNQPGCKISETFLSDVRGFEDLTRTFFACSHHRSIYYFIESLLSKCKFVGHICEDYQSYLQGKCSSCGESGSLCATLGIDADQFPTGNRSHVRFYLTTASEPPYCITND